MRRILSLAVLLASSVHTAQAVQTPLLDSGPSSLAANTTTNIGTITNAALGTSRVITIDALITRQESSAGDTWFGIGLNTTGAAPGNVVLDSNVGYLTRMRTDVGTAHQLFDSPINTENSANSSTNTTKRAIATITLAPAGIASGQFADIVVRYDDNNDGTTDHILGGYFDWSANSAALNAATQSKAYDFRVTATATDSNFALFDTGVNNANAVLAPGAADPHWSITASPAGPVGAATVQLNNGAWLANEAAGTVGGSSWISTVASGNTNIAAGNYTFEQQFDLTGRDPNSAVIVLDIAVDNTITDILLNGISQGITTGGFGGFSGPFEIDSGFQGGINTLSIIVNNAGATANPGGLRIQVLQATANIIPEPATASLALLGMGGLMMRRRRMA